MSRFCRCELGLPIRLSDCRTRNPLPPFRLSAACGRGEDWGEARWTERSASEGEGKSMGKALPLGRCLTAMAVAAGRYSRLLRASAQGPHTEGAKPAEYSSWEEAVTPLMALPAVGTYLADISCGAAAALPWDWRPGGASAAAQRRGVGTARQQGSPWARPPLLHQWRRLPVLWRRRLAAAVVVRRGLARQRRRGERSTASSSAHSYQHCKSTVLVRAGRPREGLLLAQLL